MTNHDVDAVNHLQQHVLHQLMQRANLGRCQHVVYIHSILKYLHLQSTLQSRVRTIV